MSPSELAAQLGRARALGCVEALFCLGDRPEAVFPNYREDLAGWGFASTVDYLVHACRMALDAGLVPHTNAGVLTMDEMARLQPVNASLGLMLESTSERLCGKGMPHHRAPDKRPAVRLKMIEEAGELGIPFTSGILVGIGESRDERIEALRAIRDLHRRYGHVQEAIVQPFRAHAGTPMALAREAPEAALIDAIALARMILDDDVTVQAPPNLAPVEVLLAAGCNDLGGISPLTPDFINREHAWPHVEELARRCAAAGFTLEPRLPVHAPFAHLARCL
jgi:FO synthase